MDRIMSTSIVLLDYYPNANDVDIMVFEPCDLSPPPAAVWGGIDDMVQWTIRTKIAIKSFKKILGVYNFLNVINIPERMLHFRKSRISRLLGDKFLILYLKTWNLSVSDIWFCFKNSCN